MSTYFLDDCSSSGSGGIPITNDVPFSKSRGAVITSGWVLARLLFTCNTQNNRSICIAVKFNCYKLNSTLKM